MICNRPAGYFIIVHLLLLLLALAGLVIRKVGSVIFFKFITIYVIFIVVFST
jgi:hypothetical protein